MLLPAKAYSTPSDAQNRVIFRGSSKEKTWVDSPVFQL